MLHLTLLNQVLHRSLPSGQYKRKATQTSGGLMSCHAGQFYSKVFSFELLAGSTQFVIPPVLSTKRVIGNFGAQSTSVPLKLPVTLAATKPAKEPSSRW